MRLFRKNEGAWHFAEPDHCGWAQTFLDRNSFEETIEVSSIEDVSEFCSMCQERREE